MTTPRRIFSPLWIFALVCAGAQGQHRHGPAAGAGPGFSVCTRQYAPASLLPNLGNLNHPVSTKNPEAQRFFNQGLTLIYGFNHEEALRSFRKAAELDQTLAMAHWGMALSVGPDINIDIDGECERFAYDAIQDALRLSEKDTSASERAYIIALSARYTHAPNPDRQQLAVNYAVAMADLVRFYPNDLDAATLYAESLMDLRPWKLWDNCGKPAHDTDEIVRVIESVLSRDAKHIGANHYKIHALEASTTPQNALSSATLLNSLVPNAGHLRHMPSHIYARVGDYKAAAEANVHAVQVDQPYVDACAGSIDAPECLPIYVGHYYSHNLLFLAVSYGMLGQSQPAQEAAQRAADNALRYIKQQPGLEHFLPTPPMMLTRFQRWDDILKTNPPYDSTLLISNAMWHWARAMAYAAKKDHDNAEKEQKDFAEQVQAVPATMSWGNNMASAMFPIAENMLRGKIATARGQTKAAVEFLRLALDAEAALVYDEPDPWFVPVRESLGAALLRDKDPKSAEKVFRDDLKQHPNNLRALLGLAESLQAQGQVKAAAAARSQFDRARKQADVNVTLEEM